MTLYDRRMCMDVYASVCGILILYVCVRVSNFFQYIGFMNFVLFEKAV